MSSTSDVLVPSRRSSLPAAITSGSPRTASRQRSCTGGGTIRLMRAVLVLEQHERDALGGGGALAGDHQAGHRDRRPSRIALELGARDAASLGQVGPHQLQRVLAQRDAGRAVVGQQPLPDAELAQLGRVVEVERQRELRPAFLRTGTPGAATPSSHSAWRRRPSSGPSTSAVARPRPGEPAERLGRRARARGEVADRAPRAARARSATSARTSSSRTPFT